MKVKDAECYNHRTKQNLSKRFWVLLVLPITTILLVAISPPLRSWLGSFVKPNATQLATPYRYPFSLSLPGAANTTSLVQKEITFYQQRVQADATSGLNLASLARAYLKMGRATSESSWYLLAEQTAQRSLANLPFNNNGAVLVLARVAEARHDFPQAIHAATEVLKSQGDNEDALAIMVTSHLAQGKLPQASQSATALVKRIPTLGSLTLLALTKAAQGQEQEALQAFQSALAVEEPGETGSSAWTRTLLGQFYYKRGQLQLAGELYREALRILPRYPLALVHLAELETRWGQYQAAESHYDQVIAYSRESSTTFDHVVMRGKARLKQLQDKPSEAIALLDEAEALLRQTATGHSSGSFGHRQELAQLLLERGRPQDVTEAVSLMQAEVNIRRDAYTLDTLAWALSRSGRWQEADRVIQEAIRMGTSDAGIFYRAGTIAQALGNKPKALTYWQLAQKTDPTFNAQARQLGLGLEL